MALMNASTSHFIANVLRHSRELSNAPKEDMLLDFIGGKILPSKCNETAC